MKETILKCFPESQDLDGKNTVIAFNEDVRNIFWDALKLCDISDNIETLAKAANIIRRYIFTYDVLKFSASFSTGNQVKPIPTNLKVLI